MRGRRILRSFVVFATQDDDVVSFAQALRLRSVSAQNGFALRRLPKPSSAGDVYKRLTPYVSSDAVKSAYVTFGPDAEIHATGSARSFAMESITGALTMPEGVTSARMTSMRLM